MKTDLQNMMMTRLVSLLPLLLMTTLLGADRSPSANDDSDEKPKRYSLYEAQLGRRIDFRKKEIERFSQIKGGSAVIDSIKKRLAKSEGELAYYRESVAPRSEHMDNDIRFTFERMIMAEEWDLPRLGAFESKENLLNRIAYLKARYESQKNDAHLDALKKEVEDARMSRDSDRIERAEAALAKFRAEELSKETGEEYPPDISLDEINQKWGDHIVEGYRKRTLPKRIVLTSVLILAMGGLAFWFFRRFSKKKNVS